MKNPTIAQVKGASFNLINVMEDCIEINPNDIERGFRGLERILTEIEQLNEALFFKKEKLKSKIRSEDEDKQLSLVQEIQSKLRKVKLEPLGNAKNILEKNKTILELKTLQKILRFSIEIETNAEKVLSSLLNSDIQEDWEFLCTLLYYCLKYRKESDKDIFLSFMKRIESKMSELFRESLEKKKYSTCKACYISLKQLEKENIIFETYVYSFPKFNNPVNVTAPSMPTVNLDHFNPKNNSFCDYFNSMLSTMTEHKEKSYFIFHGNEQFYTFLVDAIYRVLIHRALELYLDIKDPNLFLLALEHAFEKINDINEFIIHIHSKFEKDVYLFAALNQYILRAIQVESAAFELLFDIYVNDTPAQKKYILCGLEVKKQTNFLRAFEYLLVSINNMRKRAAKMYNEEDEANILGQMLAKMSSLIDKIVLVSIDKMQLINDLSSVYLIIKQFLGAKMNIGAEFINKINNSIQKAFDDKINYVNLTVKSKIANLFFNNSSDYKKLLNFIKTSIKEGEILQGRNFSIYCDRILSYTYKRLYKQILTILYSKEQGQNLLHSIEEIQGYILFINRTAMAHQFNYLRNICTLIIVPKKDFLDEFADLESSLLEKDIKALLKCREDKDEVKMLIYKKDE
ncbi:hypothetical protein NUSPORA_01966 [Nucleospora cyclopteri]